MKKSLILCVFSLLFALRTLPAFAHVLKTSGSIGIVMHLDPDDDPYAKSPTAFYFEIKDTKNRFNPKNCTCLVTIKENNVILYSQDLFQPSSTDLSHSSLSYAFPETGVYQVVVTGDSSPADSFQKFAITYDVRVAKEKGASEATTSQSIQIWQLGSIMAIVLIALFIFLKKKSHA